MLLAASPFLIYVYIRKSSPLTTRRGKRNLKSSLVLKLRQSCPYKLCNSVLSSFLRTTAIIWGMLGNLILKVSSASLSDVGV